MSAAAVAVVKVVRDGRHGAAKRETSNHVTVVVPGIDESRRADKNGTPR